ncbi:TrkH family potassium uptake protein [Alkalibacterium kapii]|uniref:Trk system potassium transporter TrkH n=1 Tax=Alkalibacterium kapii TaxID=426704 RepID=A0A511AUT0_9LACT|nr:TrkH family potassium uptake protein [Alkalibacterium kapii]GEK90851.1 Trk system potassium transporter TrkH [Alkalibacterium kapii]
MNKKMVAYTLGRLLQIEAVLLAIPLIVSLLYREPLRYAASFLVIALLTGGIGYMFTKKIPRIKTFYAKEGFVIVSLSWILLSFFGALPFVLNGDIPSLVDAFFETASGFTTTGASILTDVEALAHSSLFWRSFTHLIGGMGVLVFALAVLPQMESETVHIMKAEVPGPTFGKIVSRISHSARILYYMYLIFTAVVIVLLIIAGMPVFDSFIHAFGAAGTGGFGMKNGSIAPYDSVWIEVILGAGMLVFGTNFNLYFLIFTRHIKEALKSEELKWYLGFITGAIALITMQLTFSSETYHNGLEALRHSFFSVISLMTTTGFSTDNFNNWPLFSQMILILLMFVGGMAGSTGGGMKVSRIVILIKTAFSELKRNAYPNRIVSMHFEDKPVEGGMIKAIANYLIVYVGIFVLLLLIISFQLDDFTSAFTTVAATLNNIGPGLGMVGPDSSYAFFNPFNKLILSITMIMGRLEIFPILILFSPGIWRKRA